MTKEIAYICAPYAADPKHNIWWHVDLASRVYAQKATDQGYVALVPHTMFPRADEVDRVEIMACCLSVVACCDVVMVFGDRISSGMAEEITEALAMRIPVIWASSIDIEQAYVDFMAAAADAAEGIGDITP